MSNRPPTLKDCFKVKKGLCVTGDAYITGNLTLSGDFAWMNPDALLTIGNISTVNLSAGRIHSGNHELVDVFLEPDYTIIHPLSVVDHTIFESGVEIEDDLWVKGDLRVDGNAYLSAGASGTINVGDSNTDNVVFNADVNSDITPDSNITYDLGSSEQQWRELYVQDISGTRDINIDRYVNFPGLSSGVLSGKFISYQSDGEITTSSLVVDEVSRVTTEVNNTSAEWNSVYSWVNSDSATNNTGYNYTAFVNASGDTMTGALNIQNTLSATDDVTFDSDLHVQGDLKVDGDVWFNANNSNGTNTINLGDDNTDNVVFHADISSNILPDQDLIFDLGSSDQRWDNLFVDTISATGDVHWNDGDSTQANSVYTDVSETSAEWDSVYTDVSETSAEWDSVYASVTAASAEWDSVYTDVSETSAEWDSVYSFVNSDSATNNTGYNYTHFVNASGDTMTGALNIQNTLSATDDVTFDSDLHVQGDLRVDGDVWFNANNTTGTNTINLGDDNTDNVVFHADISSNILPDQDRVFDLGSSDQRWDNLFVDTISATGDVHWNDGDSTQANSVYASVTATSGDWDSVYTDVSETSAEWDSVYASVTATSGDWDSVYTDVSETSAEWNSVYATVTATSASWSNPVLHNMTRSSLQITTPYGPTGELEDWTPINSTVNVSGWWDASDATTLTVQSTEVTQWADKSTSGFDLTVPSTSLATGPHTGRVLNGLPVLDWQNTSPGSVDTVLTHAGLAWDQQNTEMNVYMVMHFDDEGASNDQDFLLEGSQNTGARLICRVSGTGEIQVGSSVVTPTSTIVESNTYIITLTVNGNNSLVRVNGTQQASGNAGINPMVDLHLGANVTDRQGLDGFIGEVIMTDDRSSTELIEGYLAHKWGLSASLPSNHQYKTSAPQHTIQGHNPEFLAMQSDSSAQDSTYPDLNYTHAMVLPYDMTVKRVVMRGAATQGATVNVSVYSNRDETDPNTVEFKFFPLTPMETQTQTFTTNNEGRIYTFSETSSANAGRTLGLSLSADRLIGHTNATISVEYDA